jgi:hypothetical protein
LQRIPIVPKADLPIKTGRFFLLKENPSLERNKTTKAKKNATKLRKKLFWIEGRSPDSLTNIFIKAKKNAEQIMKIIAFCFSLK